MKSQTIPVAIDQAYQRRQQDTEGDFYRRIVQQSPRKDFGDQTTQGLFVASADGTFLGFTNHRSPERVLQMLKQSRDRDRGLPTFAIRRKQVDRRFNPSLSENGMVVRVQARILEGYDAPGSPHEKIFQESLSRDNLWITATEHQAIVGGEVPKKLLERIARYHLVDNTRGEPPMWSSNEIQSSSLTIRDGNLEGSFQLSTKDGSRTYDGRIRGEVEVREGRIVKLNAVALGTFTGEGRYTRNGPARPFSLAISFTLADGTDIADSIPPQGGRGWIEGYLN